MTTFTADTSQFDKMIGELSAILSSPPDTVLREEVGKVLSAAVANTKAAEVSKIKQDFANAKFTLQPANLYTPKPRARHRLVKGRGGKVLYNLKWHYPDRLWSAIQKAREIDLRKRLASRGLAKQSWYKLGLLLGLNVDAPSYVRQAIPTTGKPYHDEQVQVEKGDGTHIITIQTNAPITVKAGGQAALQKAINGRVRYFAANVVHNVFDTMASAAKKYPGVTIT